MRREPTEPERRLWMVLRDSRLGGHKFRRQATIEGRIADCFCPAKGLIVEIDGETHDREQDEINDHQLARRTGFHTVRFTNHDVMTNLEGVQVALSLALEAQADRWAGSRRGTTPQPLPLKRRGS
ncbi:hypothetical protein IP81_11880 [Novosphingobium sp. AAP83]|nr:hypothetical protein IP81_11880 [Novosphingobium sp. AAP83]